MYKFFGVCILLSLVTGGALKLVHLATIQVIPPGGLIPNLVVCTVTGISFLAILWALGQLFHITEIKILYNRIHEKTVKKVLSKVGQKMK